MMIQADASRFARIEGAKIDWSEQQLARRAVREFVDALESENTPAKRRPRPMAPGGPWI